MAHATPPPQTLRERTREAVRRQVRREALQLFVAHGFDATTIDDVAAASGISARSFFRYFATKEDVLIGESIAFGQHVRDAFVARPSDEPVWTSLRACLQPMVVGMTADLQYGLNLMRVVVSAPSLRAHHVEKHLAWEQLLIPKVIERLDGPPGTRALRAQTLTHAALACLDVALAVWADGDGDPTLETLLDEVFAEIGPTT